MPDTDLEAKVLSELKVLRKNPSGVTVHTIASAQIICRLLGSGDPYLAYTRLQHALLDATGERTVRASAASLGFSSDGGTHLDRLEDAGAELGGIDQRQARRLSDQGLEIVAKLIATNWTVEAVPALTAFVSVRSTTFEIMLATNKPSVIEMSEPEIALWVGSGRMPVVQMWDQVNGDEAVKSRLRQSLSIPRSETETSVVIIWHGELWPKFTVQWLGDVQAVASETLGNKLLLRLTAGKHD